MEKTPMGASLRRRSVRYFIATIVPFLFLSILLNVRFVSDYRSNSVQLMEDLFSQSANQLSNLYVTGSNLARDLHINAALQDVLVSANNRSSINKEVQLYSNFLKIQSLLNNYSFVNDIDSVFLYLPPEVAIPNETAILDIQNVMQEEWFEAYSQDNRINRWYVNSGKLCLILPIQNPVNYKETIGYIREDFSPKRIQGYVLDALIDDSVSCMLSDDEGGMICSFGAETPQILDQTKYYVFEQRLENSGMILVYTVPWRTITREALRNCAYQIVLLVAELILLIVFSISFVKAAIQSKDNHLKLLNYQINPHFLYNTLDLINWEAITLQLPDIYRPIQALSKYYKITLNHGKDFILLSQEMEHLRLYLDLQNIRFENRIQYSIHCDDVLGDCVVLHMLLQPIVENAVLHGILKKDTGSLQTKSQAFERVKITQRRK